MGRISIVLDPDTIEKIKKMNNNGADFFELYQEVLSKKYKIGEATFKKILSRQLGINRFSTKKEETIDPNQYGMSFKHGNVDNTTTAEEKSYEENIVKPTESTDNNENSSVSEEKDAEDHDPETTNTTNDNESKQKNGISEDTDNTVNSSSNQNDTASTSNEDSDDSPSSTSQYNPNLKEFSKKLDCLTNDVQSILKQIDSINATMSRLEQKNPRKIIKQNADDFIRIYADERKSTSINLNIKIREAIQTFGKNFNVKTFSDAVNLALLVALYTYEEDENIKYSR